MLAELKDAMSSAAAALSAWPARELTLFHHNDTDGLCSGAILQRALTHGGASCRGLSVYLDTLGAVGYYRGGPDLGLKVCLEGRSGHIQWFDVQSRFDPLGVKMVGIFCDYLKGRSFIRQDQYIAGFQTLPEEVPGIDRIGGGQVRVSMRVPESLSELIRRGKALGLYDLLPPATETLGGFSDA
jgi:single-stranded-DNA-specific exonuclease